MTLQQNNSAVSDMVKSRDGLIDELNDRVAVFEEDKVVLKAALRQLQKEMQDEAPKAKKLASGLRTANANIDKLKGNITAMVAAHKKEAAVLKKAIAEKQAIISATQSNMTVIGTYVDKLEERLASFAVARRDIETREKKCEETEQKMVDVKKERDDLKAKVGEYVAEQEELKKSLEDLVKTRTELQKEKDELTESRNALLFEGRELRETIAALEDDVIGLEKIISQWKKKVADLEVDIESQADELETAAAREKEMHAHIEQKNTEVEDLKQQISMIDSKITSKTKEIEAEKEARVREAELKRVKERARQQQAVEDERIRQEKAKKEEQARREEAEKQAREKAKQFVPPPPLPPGGKQSKNSQPEKPELPVPTASGVSDDQPPLSAEEVSSAKESGLKQHSTGGSIPVTTSFAAPKNNSTAQLGPKAPPLLPSKLEKPRPHAIRRNAVPFRDLRKTFARVTGMHGFFTPSSSSRKMKVRPRKGNGSRVPPGVRIKQNEMPSMKKQGQ